MKCTKCETEFEGDICPNCNKQEVNGVTQESKNQNDVQEGLRAPNFNLPKPDLLKSKKKASKRLILEVIGGILLIFFMISSAGKVPKDEYHSLKNKYDTLSKSNKDNEKEISKLQDTKEEYKSYQKRMKPYEDLEASETKARKIASDKAISDKKAAEEKAIAEKKAAEEAQKKAEEDRIAAEAAAQAAAVQEPTPQQPQEQMVWISATGSKYHRSSSCGTMNPNTSYQKTSSDAQSSGYEPCKKCY